MIKNKQQIENIKKSGTYLTQLLHILYKKAKAGISLIELEFVAEHYMKTNNIKGAFKEYQGFPANLCLSVNDCVVHGIPDEYVLKNGDILKIDCGINYKGGITDSAITVVIGGEAANPLGYELAKTTKKSLDEAIKHIGPGKALYEYSHRVYQTITTAGFSVLGKLTGHGVGNKVHEGPHIYNTPNPEMKRIFFQPGMVLAFEPITAVSSTDFVSRPGNDWNLYCKGKDFGAQWEYTILITDDGYEILSGITEDLL
ncbi:MAG TPA: type I methionyl aminopeptidase [Candidatus Absconditabacterales bacterium]|nr:type I methionyl aminopeptidase [Candidatus Absconditabacterales bacterium]